jgi:hypothetical protein
MLCSSSTSNSIKHAGTHDSNKSINNGQGALAQHLGEVPDISSGNQAIKTGAAPPARAWLALHLGC